jgi:hypothetical protein
MPSPRRAGIAASLALSLAACSETGPSPLVEITGPEAIAPGQSAQFSAVERLPDGSTRPLAGVRWRSSDAAVLQVSPMGLATARNRGEAVLSVSGLTLQANREVLVLPDGTYRLAGRVTEAGTTTPVPAAFVEVRREAGVSPAIVSAYSGPDGSYRLYGVPGQGFLRVTHERYAPLTGPLEVTAHGVRDFQMTLGVGVLQLAGQFTLHADADSSCASMPRPLPEDLRSRSFPVTVTQQGSGLILTVSSPCTSIFEGCRFGGHATSEGATFLIGTGTDGFYGYPDLVEALWGGPGNGPGLEISGTATTIGSADRLSGRLQGAMALYQVVVPRPEDLLASCSAGRFELVRR